MHAFIDVESFGTPTPKTVPSLCTLGAVVFEVDQYGYAAVDETKTFHLGVRPNDLPEADPNTVFWWLQQKPEAINALVKMLHKGVTEYSCIKSFETWCVENAITHIWTDAPTYDGAITRAAFRKHKVPYPVKGSQLVCQRTFLKTLWGNPKKVLKPDRSRELLVHHDALDDAIYMARATCLNINQFNKKQRSENKPLLLTI